MEERVARLEANVTHIQTDIGDIKLDLRRLNDKLDNLDTKLSGRIDSQEEKLCTKIDLVTQSISELRLARAFDRIWWLLMMGGMLGLIGRGVQVDLTSGGRLEPRAAGAALSGTVDQ